MISKRLGALLVAAVGLIAMLSTALADLQFVGMGEMDQPPWWKYLLAFLCGALLAYPTWGVVSLAVRWPGWVRDRSTPVEDRPDWP